MSPNLKDVFTQINRLNKAEQIEVFRYLEQRLQDNNKEEDNPSFDDTEQSAYDLLAEIGAIGAAKNLPPDLSSNKEYFNNFGR